MQAYNSPGCRRHTSPELPCFCGPYVVSKWVPKQRAERAPHGLEILEAQVLDELGQVIDQVGLRCPTAVGAGLRETVPEGVRRAYREVRGEGFDVAQPDVARHPHPVHQEQRIAAPGQIISRRGTVDAREMDPHGYAAASASAGPGPIEAISRLARVTK